MLRIAVKHEREHYPACASKQQIDQSSRLHERVFRQEFLFMRARFQLSCLLHSQFTASRLRPRKVQIY